MKSEKLSLVLLLLAAAVCANAQETLQLETTVQKEQITASDDGEERRELVPAETVVPGERVVYTTTFRNTGDEAADNIVITNPISDDLLYVEGSAFGAGLVVEFSADGGDSFAPAAELTVGEGDESRPATAADYTHIRWTLTESLASGAQGVVRFSAILK